MNKDKKILIKFLAMLAFSLGIGAVFGYYSAEYEATLSETAAIMLDGLVAISPRMMYVSLLPMAVAVNSYIKGKKLANAALAGDEDRYEAADKLLEKGLEWTMYMTIYSFMVFGIMTSGFTNKFSMKYFPAVAGAILYFVAVLAVMSALQALIVKQVKALNPEKRGNVLDTQFKKEWYDSCDEREKAIIGAASYKAYTRGSMAILVVWMLLVFAGFILPIGPLPVISVTIIWFVMYFTYAVESKRRSKPENK